MHLICKETHHSFLLAKMAGVRSTLSPTLKSLLEQAKAEGMIGALLRELEKDGDLEFEMVTLDPESKSSEHGAMSDASKRRLTAGSIDEPVRVPSAKAMALQQSHVSRSEIPFPPGIDSLAMWGKTLIESGKYAKQNLSYEELSASGEREKQSYCSWMVAQRHRDNLTPMVRDLVQYLTLVAETQEKAGSVYPGSSSTRKFKD